MKQTAVEWLVEQLEQHHVKIDIKNTVVFEQAKAMEQKQIISVYWDSYNEGKYSTDKTADEYYKETFKQD
jgi:hypothetical protein